MKTTPEGDTSSSTIVSWLVASLSLYERMKRRCWWWMKEKFIKLQKRKNQDCNKTKVNHIKNYAKPKRKMLVVENVSVFMLLIHRFAQTTRRGWIMCAKAAVMYHPFACFFFVFLDTLRFNCREIWLIICDRWRRWRSNLRSKQYNYSSLEYISLKILNRFRDD